MPSGLQPSGDSAYRFVSALPVLCFRSEEVAGHPHSTKQDLVRSLSEASLPGRVAEYFTAMFRRKAFLHWYTGEGSLEQGSAGCGASNSLLSGAR